MSDYISREETLERLCKSVCNVSDCKCDEARCPEWYVIHDIPAADVRPVVHTKTENALDMVRAERDRQNSLWGDQSNNHPFEWMSILGEEYGELCEAVNETCFQNGTHPERGGRDKIIKEAAHIAAVAVAIIEANCGERLEPPEEE